MSKPPKVVIPGLNRGAGMPAGFAVGRRRATGKGPAELLDLTQMRGQGLELVAASRQQASTGSSTALSSTTSLSASNSTSLSQISSSLSGAISSTTSLSSAVSTVDSNQSTSISSNLSKITSLSSAVSTVDSNQSTSLSQTSSSLSGAISSTTSLSSAVSTVDVNQSTSISTNLSKITSLSSAISTVDSNQSTSLSQISSSLSAAIVVIHELPMADGVTSFYRTDTAKSTWPLTTTVSSVAGTTLTLSTTVAQAAFEPLYMKGVSRIRIWNTTRNLSAWVTDAPTTSTFTVTSAADIAAWTNGDAITIGEPDSLNATTILAIDIAPMLLATVGRVFRQAAISVRTGVIPTASSSQCRVELWRNNVRGGETIVAGLATSLLMGNLQNACVDLSPISNSNLVYIRDPAITPVNVTFMSAFEIIEQPGEGAADDDTALSLSLSSEVSTNVTQSTSLSQISSSLSGAISSTSSLSTAVSTVVSGSISAANSRIDSLSTAGGGGGPKYEQNGTLPVASNFTLTGGGTGTTLANSSLGVVIQSPSSAGDILQMAKDNTALAATTFSITARLRPTLLRQDSNCYQGCLILRNSSNGRLIVFGDYVGGVQVLIQQWASFSPGSFAGNVLAPASADCGGMPWRRIVSTAGAISFQASPDGDTWTEIASTTLATYLTASGGSCDQGGFGVRGLGGTVCYSWVLTT